MGVLFRDAEAIEGLGRVDTLVFDKTGTLTEGRPRVESIAIRPGRSEADVLTTAASLEAASEHPLARALVGEAARRGLALTRRSSRSRPRRGQGVADSVDGRAVVIGTRAWLALRGVDVQAFDGEGRSLR